MFAWLKRRLRNEHRKLAWQNLNASHDPEMKTLSGQYGDWDGFESYDLARKYSEFFFERLISGSEPTTEEIDTALKLNKGLRELYDLHGRAGRGSFDALYQPKRGWKDYLTSVHSHRDALDRQRRINEAIVEYQRTGKPPF